MNKTLLIPLITTALHGTHAVAADIYTGDDYLAIHVEAEAYDSKDDAWTYFDTTTNPDVPPDGDPNHSSTASGNAYMEVLPDRRVYGDDRDNVYDENGILQPVGGLWMVAGTGPRLNYTVDFPEAGRYIVYVRGLKNNTEDNSVHAGINNEWPNAGPLQMRCELTLNGVWHWRSAQRTTENHCGDNNTPVYIDVPSSGQHTVMFSAREDGYEQDSFFMIKNRGNNSRICEPSNLTDITCKAGSFDTADGFVDVALSINAAQTNVVVGNTVAVTHVISNKDAFDTASDTSFSVTLPEGLEFVSIDSTDCSLAGSVLTCESGSLAPQQDKTYIANYKLPTIGEANYSVSTAAAEPDDNPNNDAGAVGFKVFAAGPQVDAKLALTSDNHLVGAGHSVSLTATVTNIGVDAAEAATLNTTLPQGAELIASSVPCSGTTALSCNMGALEVGQSKSVSMDVVFAEAGPVEISASVSASNDINPSNNNAALELYASSGELFEETDGMLVAEAESFAAHETGAGESASGWYLVSDSMQPPASLYAANSLKDSASSNSYVVALERSGAATQFDAGQAATLSYRVFFNATGTYYLQARAFVESGTEHSIHYAIDGNWDHGMGALSWCDSADGWSWANATESASGCNNAMPASIEVSTPGEHVLSISMREAGIELDKLVLSDDVSLLIEGVGADSTVYADKAVDLSLTSSVDQLAMKAGVVSTLDLIVANNNATAAASDVTLTVTGLQAVAVPEANDLNCQLLEDGEAAYKFACKLGAMAPSQVKQVALPLLVAAGGESNALVTLTAMQTDDRDDNNTHAVTVSASPAAGQASGSGGGAMALSLALIGLLLLPLRAVVRRRAA